MSVGLKKYRACDSILSKMNFEIKRFDELSTTELYELLVLRSAVFVVEQDCAYQDVDGKDMNAIHVLGKVNGRVEAYLRIFRPGDYFETTSIGRVVVAKTSRKKGYAREIMNRAMGYVVNSLNEKKVTLSAQMYLRDFYEDLGFKAKGEEYLEDGIPHIKMIYG